MDVDDPINHGLNQDFEINWITEAYPEDLAELLVTTNDDEEEEMMMNFSKIHSMKMRNKCCILFKNIKKGSKTDFGGYFSYFLA